ncbi:hypothetical protein WJX81_000211 [Elliptochloris bilobata]|uniref:Uncharacterized protein n=1 Tax=Elliptochloris bilobata TaxID=381761 RepID=A0AAW1QJJ6_9CHLO
MQDCERCVQWVLDNIYRPGDVIHLFHVVTHDTVRSLECFSRPMEDDLPPEHYQEMLVEHAHTMIQERF